MQRVFKALLINYKKYNGYSFPGTAQDQHILSPGSNIPNLNSACMAETLIFTRKEKMKHSKRMEWRKGQESEDLAGAYKPQLHPEPGNLVGRPHFQR